MRWSKVLCLLVIAMLHNVGHGILIVGPKYVRYGKPNKLIVSNFESRTNEKEMAVYADMLPGRYTVTIDGVQGFQLHQEADVILLGNSFAGLIQLNKPIFKAGDLVQFRAIVLDADLKPPAAVPSSLVTVHDPKGNIIRKWTNVKLQLGVFEATLPVDITPMLGIYRISVQIGSQEIASKTFEVQEYVLSLFDVNIQPSSIPLAVDQRLDLTITAKYYVGKPVKGVATISLYLEDDILDQRTTVEVFGMAQVELQFKDHLLVSEDSHNVRVNVTFIQDETERMVTKEQLITVYKSQYRVELVKAQPEFRAGEPLYCSLRLMYRDGRVAKATAARVKVEGVLPERDSVYTSNDAGVIELKLQPGPFSETIDIGVQIDDEDLLYEQISREEEGKAYLKVELVSEVKLGRMLSLKVTCNKEMAFFVYYVVAKGNIVSTDFIQPKQATSYALQIAATDQMVPKAKIIVATVINDVILYDYIDVDFNELRNNFTLTIDKLEVKPGEEIKLSMQGRPKAYVALAVYDKSLLQAGEEHDIFWEDILDVFHGFHAEQYNEFDPFHSMLLFARTMDHLMFDTGSYRQRISDDPSARAGFTRWQIRSRWERPQFETFRTNFLESWLWKTTKLDASGRATMKEIVPDTTTAWQLTGFSIHPRYGLGIIKQPIEFVTVQEFYIVEQLPYSIRRGEAVALQFMIFSNFPQEQRASVTLHNVHNQTEFVGRPSDANILTSVLDNLENLLSVPTGCGEQNMKRLVPMVQVLDYITSIGSDDKGLVNKAKALLKMGYQNQMRYRQPDGSFGLWEKSGGGVFLTAFVGKTLATASKHIDEIEADVVLKAYGWLASRQHPTGRFDEVGPIFHRDMQGGLREGIALTSFVLIALLEQEQAAVRHSAVVQKGINYVVKALNHIDDSYDLAIATYALMLHGHSTRERFLEKLIRMSTVQHNGTERYWQRDKHEIETTAYALLSFVLAEKYVDGTAVMRWLVKQRYTPSSFPRTQDTFVGLKALTKLAEKISPTRNDYYVQLVHSGRKEEFRVNSQDIGELKHVERISDSLQLQINVAGLGFGLLQVAYESTVDLRNVSHSFNLELEHSLSNFGARLQLKVCSSFIPKLSDERSNMALVEVYFPSGYTVDQDLIDRSPYNPIQKTEIRFGATSLVVYYNSMGTERNCFIAFAYRRQRVVLKRPAYVLVHDYYDPKLKAIKMYQVDDHGLCEVCEGGECPTTCQEKVADE
uniref:TEP1-F n=1 Tax=Anopheles culicifacies TaxID=139723 RepID=A0A182MGD2_9DIPT